MPLPPYIKEELQDQERYQTVYSKVLGSAAAPTAGLHFTPELLEKIRAKGVKIGYVTLHVGLGTFRPVKEDTIEDHPMHSEYCTIPQETADLINETRKGGAGASVWAPPPVGHWNPGPPRTDTWRPSPAGRTSISTPATDSR